MPLTNGTRLGPYEIVGAIGAGGMGEVYKARDTRLDRTVAIKVLSEQFAADADRRQRFEREARAVAALSHPHICNLFDVGDAPNFGSDSSRHATIPFLVMECLEGQTLADRLVRGALPPAEVLRYAIELADALDHAHRRGLVHRDLKPGNVMLTKGGAKLLDFGLSRLHSKTDVLGLSTISPGGAPLTAEGVVLGTFPYMAPEQLAGREADARSDIFAFGAMVYEMATGRRAFEGSTAATVIGAILHTDPPPMSSLQPLAPAALDRIVSRCLAKEPDDRWQTARDLMLELKWVVEHDPVALAAGRTSGRFGLGSVAAAATLSALIVAALMFTYRREPADGITASLAFSPPDALTLTDSPAGGLVTISPDGLRLAFVAADRDGTRRLWIRPVEAFTAQALPETDGAMYPFWSPDNRFIGFFAQRKLKKVGISGGPAQALCDAVQPRGGSWSRDGAIVFAHGAGHQLSRVSASGGAAIPLAADGLNVERVWPSFLPDGRHFVYFGRPQQNGIYVAALDSSDAKLLLRDYVSVTFAPPGYLLLLRLQSRDAPGGTLMAQRFDAERLSVVGEPSPIAEQIGYYSGTALGEYAVSANGRLVYTNTRRVSTRLVWFDRGGKSLEEVRESAAYAQPSLSPDGHTVAVDRFDPGTRIRNIWLIETTRATASRFTSDPDFAINFRAIWSPDGARIVFAASGRNAPPNLYQKASDSTGSLDLLVKSAFNTQPTDWSSDGRFIVYASLNPKTMWDLWILPTTGASDERKPVPFLESDYNEHLGRISPDGRWLAYVSDESERDEVYVRTFPAAGGKRRVSINGGGDPRWRADGREFYYVTADGSLMAMSLKSEATLEFGAPTKLFALRTGPTGFGYNAHYAVSGDGQRFIVSAIVEESPPIPPKIVLNWPAALRR